MTRPPAFEPSVPRKVAKAEALEEVENYEASAALWRELIRAHPDWPDFHLRLGHALRALGAREDCVAAYRHALALDPSFGAAWWALADLKTLRFDAEDAARMEAQLARSDVPAASRTRLHFALGKAHADLGDDERSFGHYAKGNALHRVSIKHDPDVLSAYVARCKALFTPEFFAARVGRGCRSEAPIFIVGMARSGSTLLEQILASHPLVEGTRELPNLAMIAGMPDYPRALAGLDDAALKRLGERYLESTLPHRKLGRPRFTDKMGPNFGHTGFIQLVLPHARIVDMRRNPLACGVSNFVQLFPQGQNDAYRLSDIGRLYRDYAELMAHFDTVLPGRVHRVHYERLVADPEGEVRRLLDHLGLPFEPGCLEFHNTERVVTTASAQQVRSPLYRGALEQWKRYEPWLGPLKSALGPALDDYPA